MSLFVTTMPEVGETWTEVDGAICGAQADDLGAIGEGASYRNRIEPTSEPIKTLDDLIAGFSNAKSGSGYEACHNVELGESLSHCFDMHGGRDRRDGTDTAGTAMRVTNNSFGSPETALVVRGTPDEGATIGNNWFYHDSLNGAILAGGDVNYGANAFGYRGEYMTTPGAFQPRHL